MWNDPIVYRRQKETDDRARTPQGTNKIIQNKIESADNTKIN